MPRKSPEKSRSWVFTLFNHESLDQLKGWLDEINWSYWEAGNETCPTTGRQHWQGWLYLKSPRTEKAMIKEIQGNGRIEMMKGKWQDSVTYCRKEGKFHNGGTLPKQGKRTDLEEAIACESVRELFDRQAANFQSIRVLEKHLEYCEEGKFRQVEMHYFSECDLREFEDLDDCYTYSGHWKGYDGQTNVLVATRKRLMEMEAEVVAGLPILLQCGGTCRQCRVTAILIIE